MVETAQKKTLNISIEYSGNYILTAGEIKSLLEQNNRFISNIEVERITE